LIRSETEGDLLAAICQIAVDIGGFRLAWVGYALDDADKSIVCQSHAGLEDGYLSNVRVTWDEIDPAGQGPAGKAIRHGEPVVIPDLETDESFRPWLEAARARGFRGVIALPLTDEKRTFGVFVLYLPEVRQPLPDELRLLRELADDMAFGIVTIRTRLDRQRLHTAVEQVAAAVSAATSKDFFEQLARNMAMAVGAQAGFVARMLPGEPHTARTIAAVVDNKVTANFDYVLQGTLCEIFLTSDTCVIHKHVAEQFPQSSLLAALGAEGFVGRRLTNAAGEFIGQLFVIFREPLKEAEFVASTLRIFSARAAAELERQETETQLREQAALLDKAQDAILVRDLDHHITYWNHSAERLFGWAAKEVLGRSVRELFFSEPGLFDRAMEQLLAHGEWTGELRKKCKDGRMLDVEAHWTLVRDAADQPKAVLAIHTDITERKAAEQAVQRSEERFRELAENIREVFWMTDPAKNQILYISPAYEKIWGRTCASLTEWPRQWLEAVHPDDRTRITESIVIKQARGDYDEEYRIQRPDGTTRWIHDRAFPVRSEKGEVFRVVGTAEDITERRQLEEQFRQSQKMEAVGQLAGGVAHDFNNILTVMMMQAALTAAEDNLPGTVRDGLREIRAAAERAASLTRQLLLFSRKQVMQSRQLDLNEIVTGLTKMLQRIIGEDVRLQLNLHPRPLLTRADAGMLDQVLMNLVVNARDAMPGGGRLFIETSEKTFTAAEAVAIPDAAPGRYVCLRVTDTGCGIAPENLSRIFEPFFTTKEPGKGTGLGLATVFGIIKQHNGALAVESEIGKGTTFRLFLRADVVTAKSRAETTVQTPPRGGTETILLVEDEPSVRILTRVVLERAGYHVLEAAHGIEALKIWDQATVKIQLLLTDIVMPEGIGGRELAARLRQRTPGLRVVFTSGYSADIAGRELTLQVGENFIQKPASPHLLLETIRRCLDA
jgi:PAS domain S-box-containing protein